MVTVLRGRSDLRAIPLVLVGLGIIVVPALFVLDQPLAATGIAIGVIAASALLVGATTIRVTLTGDAVRIDRPLGASYNVAVKDIQRARFIHVPATAGVRVVDGTHVFEGVTYEVQADGIPGSGRRRLVLERRTGQPVAINLGRLRRGSARVLEEALASRRQRGA